MHKIGVLFGVEDTFPWALIDRINSMEPARVQAEMIKLDAVRMAHPTGYRVIIDRVSQHIPFYRTAMKNAVLTGSTVINNPFWWGADDKFFNYALASKLDVAVPKTVLLPHYKHPPGTTEKSMRNLNYPLGWDAIFDYIGFPAYLKPFNGDDSTDVHLVNSPEHFFKTYHTTGDLCMTLQENIEFEDYYRCYVVNQKLVHVMRYDPRLPPADRYVKDAAPLDATMHGRLLRDCLVLCRALGYDFNMVEFAVRQGVPYAIDFLNPAPDADYGSVGPDNFEWVVQAVAEMAVEKALSGQKPMREYRWDGFLDQSLLVS